MHIAERKARELLEVYGAEFLRFSSNGHEVWRLPTGRNWVCSRPGQGTEVRSWTNSLHQLQRLLNGVKPKQTREAEPGQQPCPGCHHMAKLTELGLCQGCTDNGIPTKPKRGIEVIPKLLRPLEVVRPHVVEGEVQIVGKAKNKSKPWTDAEIERLRKLTADGWSAAKIAETMGRTDGAVYQARSEHGIKAKHSSKRYSPAEESKMLELAEQGLTHAMIAKRLGRKKDSVQKHLAILNKGSAGKPTKRRPAPASFPPRKPTPGVCQIRLEYPGGQTVHGTVGRDLADELALRIISGEA